MASGLSAFVSRIVEFVVATTETIRANLAGIATTVTVFEQLWIPGWIKKRVRRLWRKLSAAVALAWDRVRRSRPRRREGDVRR